MKNSKKTPAQKAKERLANSMIFPPETPTESVPSNTKPVKVVSSPLVAQEEAPVAAPVFKTWRIKEFRDISEVDAWQMDKLLYFMNHLLRKCRLLKRRLIEFTYHEQGRIEVIMEDIETGERFHEPAPTGVVPAAETVLGEEDPLA